ncbi:MAG: sarcosine oxidase subunit gamma family protein [Albidovulum sp.]
MAYDVTITRPPLRAAFDLKGTPDEITKCYSDVLPPLPGRPNSLTTQDGHDLLWIGPDHWLLLAPIAQEEMLVSALRSGGGTPADIATTLISDTLTFFAVTGSEAGEVMAVASPLDLHPDAFSPDGASWTEAFGTKALIRRIASGYEIAVDRSYGDWFEATLWSVTT